MLQYCFRSIASLVYHRILDKTYPSIVTNLRYFRQISPLWRQQRAIWSQISPAYLPALWATLKQEQMSKKVRLLDLNCWIWILDLLVSSLIFLADVVTKVGIIGMILPLHWLGQFITNILQSKGEIYSQSKMRPKEALQCNQVNGRVGRLPSSLEIRNNFTAFFTLNRW